MDLIQELNELNSLIQIKEKDLLEKYTNNISKLEEDEETRKINDLNKSLNKEIEQLKIKIENKQNEIEELENDLNNLELNLCKILNSKTS